MQIMYWFYILYLSLSILLVSYTAATTATDESASIVNIDNDCANRDCDDAKPASLPIDKIVNTPQQLLQQSRLLDSRHRNRRHQLTSDERHELQRRAMQDVVIHHQQHHDKQQQPQHSSYFSSVQEMRSYYYFHSGVIEIAAKNAIQMASSASASATLSSSDPPDVINAAPTAGAATTAMDDENDILVIENGMKDQGADIDEKKQDNFGSNYDTNDFHEGYDDNDDDHLLYQLAQNAIEIKLMHVEKQLKELILIKQALDDKVGTRDEENHHPNGNHHDNLRPDLARANHDTTYQRDNELLIPSESKLSMSMDDDDDDDDSKNSKNLSIESDSDSCSNIRPAKADKKQVQHDGRSYLSSTTTFTNAEYTNIHHRLNCHSPHRHYRLVDGISLPDAVEKWRRMRQTFWKLFDIPIREVDDVDEDDNSINDGLGDHARGSTFPSSPSSSSNPYLYVNLLSSSSSPPSSSEMTFHIQRGLFAARDFKMGEVVYTQRKNALYFQELSSWESYLHSLQQSLSSSGSKSNNTINHQHSDDGDDACLAIEWSFMKRISRPGRWLVMLVLDEGVYMRRKKVAINASTASAANENDMEDDDDDDDDDEWLEGNVALDDERSLDFVALRSIRMGEEIIDAGIDIIDGSG